MHDEGKASPVAGRNGRGRRQIAWTSWAWRLAAVAVPVAALIAALWLGGAARQPVPFGLPDAGPLTKWGLPAARLLTDVAAMLSLGALLAASWLLPAERGWLTPAGVRCARMGGVAAAVWAIAAIATMLFSLSEAIGLPISQVLDAASIRSYATTISQGRAETFVAVIAAVVAVLAWRTTRANAAGLLLVYAYIGLLPPNFASHAATAANHNLAVTTTAMHVVAVATWVGGLVALVAMGRAAREDLAYAVPRFSRLALYCFVATGITGLLNAGVRLDWSLAAVTAGGYGGLLIAKSAALAVLGVLGWLHRRREMAALATIPGRRGFLRLAGVEVLVMLATVGIAVALSRTPPPPRPEPSAVAGLSTSSYLDWDLIERGSTGP